MNTQSAAAFIADRALTLAYESRQYPSTGPMARAWLRRATNWAVSHGQWELCRALTDLFRTLGQ